MLVSSFLNLNSFIFFNSFSGNIFLIVLKNSFCQLFCVLVIRVELKGSYLEKP